ncbi:MAG TPA: LLM class flavin-dependent oxidoreductase [Burkholderiales bacterium]|nr:LLM class flavin-dependent oxidoreductase [Burkholderiales bacterium]
MIPFSILDLSPIPKGSSASAALNNTLALAQRAEQLGYKRYWLAEHHNMPGIASAATAIVIGHVAGGTRNIRVGSGGIMLPNHSPLMVAEQFGTLASLYPGRIDLGLGRAPGTDMLTARALRRSMEDSAEQFPQDVLELQNYFAAAQPGQHVRAVPGAGIEVPIWLLGSSLFSAQLAAMLGLPFAFASHFAPELMIQALEIYRSRFQPSKQLDRPYAMLGANVLAADNDAEARRQFTSQQQSFINLRRGSPGQVPPPIDNIDTYWTPSEKAMVERSLAVSFVGSRETVQRGLAIFIESMQPDELMITAHIHDQPARLRSIDLVSQVRENLFSARHEKQGAPREATADIKR